MNFELTCTSQKQSEGSEFKPQKHSMSRPCLKPHRSRPLRPYCSLLCAYGAPRCELDPARAAR